MFADTAFDAALFAGTPDQVAQWAGTRAAKLLDEVVLPVCAPSLLNGADRLSPQDIAKLPLLQQSTRTDAWRQWFDAQGVVAPQAMTGARLELFSMTAAAAVHGMGVPRSGRRAADELERGDLVVACDFALGSARAYYLVWPERTESSPATQLFLDWLMLTVRAEA